MQCRIVSIMTVKVFLQLERTDSLKFHLCYNPQLWCTCEFCQVMGLLHLQCAKISIPDVQIAFLKFAVYNSWSNKQRFNSMQRIPPEFVKMKNSLQGPFQLAFHWSYGWSWPIFTYSSCCLDKFQHSVFLIESIIVLYMLWIPTSIQSWAFVRFATSLPKPF